jgi:hypothetical protein
MTAMKRSIVVDLVPAMKCLLFALSRLTKERRLVRLKRAGKQKGRHLPTLLNKSFGFPYGPPKMSELPNVVAGDWQGTGRGNGTPARSDARQASIAGQSAAFRTSFHTAKP